MNRSLSRIKISTLLIALMLGSVSYVFPMGILREAGQKTLTAQEKAIIDTEVKKVASSLEATQSLKPAERIRALQNLKIVLDPKEEEYFLSKVAEIAPKELALEKVDFYQIVGASEDEASVAKKTAALKAQVLKKVVDIKQPVVMQPLEIKTAAQLRDAIKTSMNDKSLTSAFNQLLKLSDAERYKAWNFIQDKIVGNEFAIRNKLLSHYTDKVVGALKEFFEDKLQLGDVAALKDLSGNQSLKQAVINYLAFIPNVLLADHAQEKKFDIKDLPVQISNSIESSIELLAISNNGKWALAKYRKSGWFSEQGVIQLLALNSIAKRYEPSKINEISGNALAGAFSTDGSQAVIAFENGNKQYIQIVDVAGSIPARIFEVNDNTARHIQNLDNLRDIVINNEGNTLFILKGENGQSVLAALKVDNINKKFSDDIQHNLSIDELTYDDDNKQLLAWGYSAKGTTEVSKWKVIERGNAIKLTEQSNFELNEKVTPVLAAHNIIFVRPRLGQAQNKLILQLINESTGQILNTITMAQTARYDERATKVFALHVEPALNQLVVYKNKEGQPLTIQESIIKLAPQATLTLEESAILQKIAQHALGTAGEEKLQICSVNGVKGVQSLNRFTANTSAIEKYATVCSLGEAQARRGAAVTTQYARTGAEAAATYAKTGAEAAKVGAATAGEYARTGIEAARKTLSSWWNQLIKYTEPEKEATSEKKVEEIPTEKEISLPDEDITFMEKESSKESAIE
jgi:hypothetical protein